MGADAAFAGRGQRVVFAGRFVFVPFLRFIARVRLRELFTAAALLIVTGMSYLMIRIGFSPALGAFWRASCWPAANSGISSKAT
jgi:predicted Kef-type K+ transport protein